MAASGTPEEDLSVRAARARYFEANDFGADGGYGAKWVHLKLGPLPLAFPNTAARVAAVKLHDLHHVATGYATTATGEAEIGAWEVASGCGRYSAAWMLNLWALAYGVLISPGAIFGAFVRGRRSTNLYHGAMLDDAILDGSVSELRDLLHVPDAVAGATLAERLAFTGWLAVAWLWTLLSLAPLAALLAWVVRLVF